MCARSAFLKEWGRVNGFVLVVLSLSVRAAASQRRVDLMVGCRVPHQSSSI
jgi:hypothetical protein